MELDPGKHVVRMTLPGKPPVARDIVVVEGAKNRTIEFDVGRPDAPAAIGATVPPPESPSAVPAGAIVFGGLGLASLAAFGVLAASGTRDLDTLHATCGKTRSCPEDEVDGAKKKIIIGDVSSRGCGGHERGHGWTIAHHAGSSRRATSAPPRCACPSPSPRRRLRVLTARTDPCPCPARARAVPVPVPCPCPARARVRARVRARARPVPCPCP